MSLNKAIIMGRLTKDPELRKTQGGISVTTFTLAVDRDFKAQDGSKETDFINCVAWRNTGEFVAKNMRKGSMAIAEGRIQVRSYTDKAGNKRTATEVVADRVYFGESRADREEADYIAAEKGKKEYTSPEQYVPVEVEDDGDLPF